MAYHLFVALDVGGQAGFWVYRPCYHRCAWCGRRLPHVLLAGLRLKTEERAKS
jgi:hypothetical protein